jgi:hypothetical protein
MVTVHNEATQGRVDNNGVQWVSCMMYDNGTEEMNVCEGRRYR